MSRRFEDPTLQGIRRLEVWAGEDEKRGFQITWDGPRRAVGALGWTGGYKVAVWTGERARNKSKTYYLGRTLLEAAEEATRNADG